MDEHAHEDQLSHLSADELRERLEKGELTPQQVDKALQQQARRAAAQRSSDELLPDEHVTAEGFGSGQGMGTARTGQGPNRPDEEGFPRTQKDKEDWPS